MYEIVWTALSLIALGTAMGVVTRKNPVYGAILLMGFFASICALFAFLGASFLAAAQLFVYVGAIIVLYLFVIMMLDFSQIEDEDYSPFLSPGWGAILSFGLFALLTIPLNYATQSMKAGPLPEDFGTTMWLAQDLYEQYPFPIELASVLLITALVGAFALCTKVAKKPEEAETPPAASGEVDETPQEPVAKA